MTLMGSILFSVEAIEGLRRLLEMLFIVAHLFEGRQEKDFCLTIIVDEDSGCVPSVDVDGDNHRIGM
jgi:hypothetical protein